ncbi:MAG: ShlB/FhaC/HecB family hemolysin secretion/activation protein [Acidobacteriaceae bacterium]|nr:ShlB/FhaC/HecB family hemolysin secretion/activation protein [Acidobacteriaceae bacterium]
MSLLLTCDLERSVLRTRARASIQKFLIVVLAACVFGEQFSPAEQLTSNTAPALPIPVLKGVVFVSDPSSVRHEGVNATGISIYGLEMLDRAAFRKLAASYLGQPLTRACIAELTHAVVNFYRAHGRPLVDVITPEQDVQSGAVQIVVTEFHVGEIRTEGNRWFSPKVVAAPLSLRHGDVVDINDLLGQLDTANSNPFRRVNLIYRPGAERGYTDLVLQTQDRFPLRISGGYDNSGTTSTGHNRWNLGVTWGNALWHDQQLSYQFTSSTNFWTDAVGVGPPGSPSFTSHSLSWTMPLPDRRTLTIFGSYEQAHPNIGAAFGLLGRSAQASLRYSIALPRTEALVESFQAGYDFKTTNNNLDFGGTQVSHNSTEIDQFPIAYSATVTDRWGVTNMATRLVLSPGRMTPNNNDAAFQPAPGQSGRVAAAADYVYWRSDLGRVTKLPGQAAWLFRFIGQTSDRSLLATEQLAGGGPDILRGYDPYAVIGDQGIMLSNELQSPTFSRHTENLRSTLMGQTQLVAFWDYASLHNKHAAAGNLIADLNASSAGLGVRYNIRTHASVHVDYGWQLLRLPGTSARGRLASISINIGN